MKITRIILLSAAIIAASLWGIESVGAQPVVTEQEDPIAKRTPEEREYYRLYETPENELSLDDRLLKYRIYLITGKSFYVENGDVKSRCTEEDFIRIGAKPSMYEIFIRDLEGNNDFIKQAKHSEEERTAISEKFIKETESIRKEIARKIAELEKRKALEELNLKRTPEEREFYRLFETPENELPLDDRILRYKILHLTGESFYVENGDVKSRCTEEDFIRIGASPSMHKIFMEGLQGNNDFIKQANHSIEERTAISEQFVKQAEEAQKEIAGKIAELEKMKAAR